MSQILQIPITSDQAQLQSFTILNAMAGNNYYLRFDWNEGCQTYFISIQNNAKVDLLLGVPMNVNVPLTSQYTLEGMFPGILLLYDTSGVGEECEFGALGQRCILLYQESPD